jgi:hypothetical protein
MRHGEIVRRRCTRVHTCPVCGTPYASRDGSPERT